MTDYSKDMHPSQSNGSLAGAMFAGLYLFLDRLVFYSLWFSFNSLRPEARETGYTPIIAMLVVLTTIVVGMLTDFGLEKRTAMVIGAGMSFVGCLFLFGGPDFFWIGTAFWVVGGSLSVIALRGYFGFVVGHGGGKMDGAFMLLDGVLNIASLVSGIIMVAIGIDLDNMWVLVVVAGLAVLQLVVALVGRFANIMPSTSQDPQLETRPNPVLGILGLFGMFVFVLVLLYMQSSVSLHKIFSLVIWPLMILAIVGGFLVLAFGGREGNRGNMGILLLVMFFALVGNLALSRSGDLYYRHLDSIEQWENYRTYMQIDTILQGFLAIITGVLLILLFSPKRELGGSGLRLTIGSAAMLLAPIPLLIVAGNVWPIWFYLLIGVVSSIFVSPILSSLSWQMSAGNLKGTAMGLFAGFTSFAYLTSRPLEDILHLFRDREVENALENVLMVFFTLIAIGLAVLTWVLLQKAKPNKVEEVHHNPFE